MSCQVLSHQIEFLGFRAFFGVHIINELSIRYIGLHEFLQMLNLKFLLIFFLLFSGVLEDLQCTGDHE